MRIYLNNNLLKIKIFHSTNQNKIRIGGVIKIN